MKNLKGCRTKFGMTGKLAAVVFSAVLMAFPFASCNTDVNGDEPTIYTVTVSSSIEHGKVSADKTSAEAGASIKLTATADSGYELDSYSVTDANGNAIAVTDGTFTMPEGNVTVMATFAVSYFGTKAPGEAKAVGDIVFNDGSSTPYTAGLTLDADHKNAAIAVIFYVGNELNSGDDTSNRTLGVGLKHGSSLVWCTSSANASNTKIATILCTKTGDTISGDKNGSDNLEQIGEFLAGNSSTDDTTGDGADGRYPAFYFAKNYANQEGSRVNGTSYADNWYLPSIAELDQIWKSKDIVDAASALCEGDEFGTDWYWSSSQCYYNMAWAYMLDFDDCEWFDTKKDEYGLFYVCAVREF